METELVFIMQVRENEDPREQFLSKQPTPIPVYCEICCLNPVEVLGGISRQETARPRSFPRTSADEWLAGINGTH